jgi:hypothetical protein
MHNLSTIQDCLESKLQILEQIKANFDTQIRFIGKRKIKGLDRLTRELQDLINNLAGIDAQLGKDREWLSNPELQAMIQTIEAKQREILELGAESLQNAGLERIKIADELQQTRQFKKAHHQYVNTKYDINQSGFDHMG